MSNIYNLKKLNYNIELKSINDKIFQELQYT